MSKQLINNVKNNCRLLRAVLRGGKGQGGDAVGRVLEEQGREGVRGWRGGEVYMRGMCGWLLINFFFAYAWICAVVCVCCGWMETCMYIKEWKKQIQHLSISRNACGKRSRDADTHTHKRGGRVRQRQEDLANTSVIVHTRTHVHAHAHTHRHRQTDTQTHILFRGKTGFIYRQQNREQ